jgi:hypothetical protein
MLLVSLPALASSGGPYDLFWNTVDSGGQASRGGAYAVAGTIGQPDAGRMMSGGDYTLSGGFWQSRVVSAPPSDQRVYVPLVVK